VSTLETSENDKTTLETSEDDKTTLETSEDDKTTLGTSEVYETTLKTSEVDFSAEEFQVVLNPPIYHEFCPVNSITSLPEDENVALFAVVGAFPEMTQGEKLHSERVKMKTTLETSEDEKYTRNE
jgi:hypothetical protein